MVLPKPPRGVPPGGRRRERDRERRRSSHSDEPGGRRHGEDGNDADRVSRLPVGAGRGNGERSDAQRTKQQDGSRPDQPLVRALRADAIARTIDLVTDSVVRKELEAAIEARKELGSEMEPAIIDAFVERIERRLEARGGESEQALKRKLDHQKEMVLGAMGVSIPLFAIAAIFTGLAGVVAVCAALAVIAVVASR
jgi:hypothetical protein